MKHSALINKEVFGFISFLLIYFSINSFAGSICTDGTYSESTGQGTCSHHGGIRKIPTPPPYVHPITLNKTPDTKNDTPLNREWEFRKELSPDHKSIIRDAIRLDCNDSDECFLFFYSCSKNNDSTIWEYLSLGFMTNDQRIFSLPKTDIKASVVLNNKIINLVGIWNTKYDSIVEENKKTYTFSMEQNSYTSSNEDLKTNLKILTDPAYAGTLIIGAKLYLTINFSNKEYLTRIFSISDTNRAVKTTYYQCTSDEN